MNKYVKHLLNYRENKVLFILFLGALIIRLLFVFFGAKYLYGDRIFETNDTFSYVQSFLNLLNHGEYTFDFGIKDAYFGRLPGYPFFWGLHYLIFGTKTFMAVAFSQSILDSLSVVLAYLIIFKVTKSLKAAKIGALIALFNPFTIMWVTINTTEIFATFLAVLVLYKVICKSWFYRKPLLLGLLLAACFYTRVYLIFLLPIILFVFFITSGNRKIAFKKGLVIVASFLFLYSFWPIRNYVFHDEIQFLKPKTAGYATLTEDVLSFRDWVYCWNSSDWSPWFEQIINTKEEVKFPKDVIINNEERLLVDSLIVMCRTCGGGFHSWKSSDILADNCNHDIAIGFNKLRKIYTKRSFLTVYVKIPLLNLQKAFFDFNIESVSSSSKLILMIFAFLVGLRGIIMVIGLVFSFIKFRTSLLLIIGLFSFFMLILLSLFIRQVEIRYLIQVDMYLIISFAVFLGLFIFKNKGMVGQRGEK